jgi:hypothetical protein
MRQAEDRENEFQRQRFEREVESVHVACLTTISLSDSSQFVSHFEHKIDQRIVRA